MESAIKFVSRTWIAYLALFYGYNHIDQADTPAR